MGRSALHVDRSSAIVTLIVINLLLVSSPCIDFLWVLGVFDCVSIALRYCICMRMYVVLLVKWDGELWHCWLGHQTWKYIDSDVICYLTQMNVLVKFSVLGPPLRQIEVDFVKICYKRYQRRCIWETTKLREKLRHGWMSHLQSQLPDITVWWY